MTFRNPDGQPATALPINFFLTPLLLRGHSAGAGPPRRRAMVAAWLSCLENFMVEPDAHRAVFSPIARLARTLLFSGSGDPKALISFD